MIKQTLIIIASAALLTGCLATKPIYRGNPHVVHYGIHHGVHHGEIQHMKNPHHKKMHNRHHGKHKIR